MCMSPPIFSAIWTICYHCSMLLLQILLLQSEHRSNSLSMTILGLVHASNSCHTIHHEAKDMSTMNRESWTKHQPCTHVHQYHTIYHNISSMECIDHMQEYVPIVYQTYDSNKCHITHDIPLPWTSNPTMYLNHLYINRSSKLYHPIRHVPNQVHQPYIKMLLINDVQHKHLINSSIKCPNMYLNHMQNSCTNTSKKYSSNNTS